MKLLKQKNHRRLFVLTSQNGTSKENMSEHDKDVSSALSDQVHTEEQLHTERLEDTLQHASDAASDHVHTRAPLLSEKGREERLKQCIKGPLHP